MSWKITPINHKGNKRLKVAFGNIPFLNIKVRQIEGALWSKTLMAWHVPDTVESRTQLNYYNPSLSEKNKLQAEENEDGNIEYVGQEKEEETTSYVLPHIVAALKQFEYYLQSKRYRPNTIKSYKEALFSFLKFFPSKQIADLNNQDLVVYNNEYIIKRNLSASYQSQIVNAIKLFFTTQTETALDLAQIHRPKTEKRHPNVLSKAEIKRLLASVGNIKHRTMLTLTYACGLRCGEVLNLQLNHIDSDRMVLYVKNAKGGKDRMVPISMKLVEELRDYYTRYKPITYLFEGQVKGNKYDVRSFQLVLKQAIVKAKINKPVTLHWLRHSYATHLLDTGTDLRYIQELLGHRSSRTTEIYTHVSTRDLKNIVSPFDTL